MQLPQVTVVEKPGELRKPFADESQHGNPERSLLKGQEVSRNAQRLGIEETRPIKSPRAPGNFSRKVDEIVRPHVKTWDQA